MPKGGARPGAGHPGGPNKRSRKRIEFSEQAAREGISPLEVMLAEMRTQWAANTAASRKEACSIAKDVAPFCHPRLQMMDIAGDLGSMRSAADMTDDELANIAAGSGNGADPAPDDPHELN